MIKNSLENLDINFVLTLARTLVQNFTTTTPLIPILHFMILPDLAMTNIIENLSHEHFILFGHATTKHLLVAIENLTLVLANAPRVIISPLLDAINHHINHFRNYALIAI